MGNFLAKALIVVSSHSNLGETGLPTGWYLSEVSHVYSPLSNAGIEVEFASPKGGIAPMDPKSLNLEDKLNKEFVDKLGLLNQGKINLQTQSLVDVKDRDYDIIYFAGGHGAMWDLKDDKYLQKIASNVYEKGGIVSSVCHGAAALVDLKLKNGDYLIKNKKVAAFSNAEESAVELTKIVPFSLEDKIKERGAIYTSTSLWQSHVEKDERLITGQNPASAHEVGKSIVDNIKSIKNK